MAVFVLHMASQVVAVLPDEARVLPDATGHAASTMPLSGQTGSLGIRHVPSSVLALLKYPFYPLFNFDNGMNLISKSLTILTSARLLVVFAFAHIFWRYFVFAGF